MESIPIKVESYSGYKAEEYPKCFIWEDILFDITEIIDRWYEAYDKPDYPSINYYKVRTQPTGTYLLRYEIEKDKWFLVI
jgi:hypothetical protein